MVTEDSQIDYLSIISNKGIYADDAVKLILKHLLKLKRYCETGYLLEKLNKQEQLVSRSKISSTLKKLTDGGIVEKRTGQNNNHFEYKIRALKTILEESEFVDIRAINLNVY